MIRWTGLAPWEFEIAFFTAGMFFAGFPKFVEIMKATDPASALPHFDGPVLFMNGTKDHRDSEKR